MSSPIVEASPVAIETLPDDTVLILNVHQTNNSIPGAISTIKRYRFGQLLNTWVLGQENPPGVQQAAQVGFDFEIEAHDMAFLPHHTGRETSINNNRVDGLLFVVPTEGNQAFAFKISQENDSITFVKQDHFYPLRRFSGKALVQHGNEVYYDLGHRWLPIIRQNRVLFEQTGSMMLGSLSRHPALDTPYFDGKEPDCVWHRLFIDACIPQGTEIIVESRAANRLEELATLPEKEGYSKDRLYLRANGSEIPYHQPFSERDRAREGVGTWELLFQKTKGRYLQLRITLTGTQRSTPSISSLRVYYPRFSYLQAYLPAFYGEDESSASFLERFLANMEGFYTVLEGHIAESQSLFDVRSTAKEYLDWLASWFGVILDPTWEEFRKRLFIKYAMSLFMQRGTTLGLIRLIRLATDPCPDESLFEDDSKLQGNTDRFNVRVVEQFLTRSIPGIVFGDTSDLSGPGNSTASAPWKLTDTAARLHGQFRDFLENRYETVAELNDAWGRSNASQYESFDEIQLIAVRPTHSRQATDWQQFISTELGFTYEDITEEDLPLYQAFLRRKYRYINRVARAYQRSYSSFGSIPFPQENDFPHRGDRLQDWIQFVSRVIPIHRNAHQFTVLIPFEVDATSDEQMTRLALIKRIVQREKPAHSTFDVKPYWALFRVGEARLGFETQIGEGSRFVPSILGRTELAEGYITTTHPWNVEDRFVSDRDSAGSNMIL